MHIHLALTAHLQNTGCQQIRMDQATHLTHLSHKQLVLLCSLGMA